jgi:protein dopey
MTGNALYEAVEPLAVWKQLFAAVRLEVINSSQSTLFEAMPMVKFVLTRLRAQEEEIQEVHLPIFFTGLLEVLQVPVIPLLNHSRPFSTLLTLTF